MPAYDEGARGAGAWVRAWWRALVAELVATALLVCLGLAPLTAAAPQLAHVAMAFGGLVCGNALAFGAASGAHMNPAVTLAALAAGRLRAPLAAAYALAQGAGALLGFAALRAGAGGAGGAWGATRPAPAVGALRAAALEAGATAALALACCAAWGAPRPDSAAPLKLGLLVAGLVYSIGEATGASLNPARSFAPALLLGQWDDHWVYWVGPLGGALLAAALHRFVLAPPARPAPPPADELPLADKP